MKRILLVDDSKVSIRLFTALLEGPAYEIVVVETGREALSHCAEHKPDLVILDLRLPGMDGFEVARRLKGAEATRKIPIVAVTAYGHGHATDEAMAAGIDRFMAKPFSGVALRETIADFLGTGG